MFSYKIDADSELRPIDETNAEELHELVISNFEHIREWSAWLKRIDRPTGHTREWIRRNRVRMTSGEGFDIAIWTGGKMAGQIGYNYFDHVNKRTEIGFWLGKSFQGRGLVTRSCRVLISNAFDNLGMNRVELRCASGNRKSRNIAAKLGFREEATLRRAEWLHDRFVDLVVYSKLADEWTSEPTDQ